MNSYWQQWSKEEIEAMQGLEQYYRELDKNDDSYLSQDEPDANMIQEEDLLEQLSLETLGMSWKDFI